MIFDKNDKRIGELTRKLARGEGNKEKIAHRIKELKFRGAEWWIRYWDKLGRPHDELCPTEYQTEKDAQRYYNRVTTGVDDSTHAVPSVRKATMSVMSDFFLEDKKKKADKTGKKAGYNASKTICGNIKALVGKATLEECTRNPQLLIDHFDKLHDLKPGWSDKTCWNYFKIFKAIISKWIRKHLLNIANPMNAVDEPDPNVRVMDYVPTQEDYECIITTAIILGLPQTLINLIGAVRYSGLRIGEILKWQVEDIILKPDDGGRPYFFAWILKQRRNIRVAIPMLKQLAEILEQQINGRIGGPVWPWKNPPYHLFEIQEDEEKPPRQLYEIAGVKVPRPFHDFRKTIKMELKRAGVPKEITKSMQGCKSDAMDDWYTHFSRVDLERAVEYSYRDQTVTKNKKGE